VLCLSVLTDYLTAKRAEKQTGIMLQKILLLTVFASLMACGQKLSFQEQETAEIQAIQEQLLGKWSLDERDCSPSAADPVETTLHLFPDGVALWNGNSLQFTLSKIDGEEWLNLRSSDAIVDREFLLIELSNEVLVLYEPALGAGRFCSFSFDRL
jgi:hypothetical protein